jgi:fluoride exporter
VAKLQTFIAPDFPTKLGALHHLEFPAERWGSLLQKRGFDPLTVPTTSIDADRRPEMRPTWLDLRRLAAIYAGGVVGALARVGLAEATPHAPGDWPWGTFAVNMAGALLLGYFFARLSDHPEDSLAHPFLTTGICGTLTTFATVQLELFEMVDGGRLGLAFAYLAATVVAGLFCIRAGIALERRPWVPE